MSKDILERAINRKIGEHVYSILELLIQEQEAYRWN